MLGEEEGPLSEKQIEYIKVVLERVRTMAAPDPDRLVLDPLLDKMHKALKNPGQNEVEFSPTEDWNVTGSRYKHKKTGRELPASLWGDILEKAFLAHKIHFEFHESGDTTKYVVFFKIFNEAFGRREEEIDRLLAAYKSTTTRRVKRDKERTASTSASATSPKTHKRKTEKKKKSTLTRDEDGAASSEDDDHDDRPAPPLSKRRERHLRKRESNLSASSSSRN